MGASPLAAAPLPVIDPSGIGGTAAVEDAMASYYVKRASYYERVYHKPERQTDLRAMEAWLGPRLAGRRVLEVACGTGWWTPHGARQARRWLATDLNPETMAVARTKPLPAGVVEFRPADAYTLAELGDETFDAAFAGCWWSHVPLQRLSAWLGTLHARLEPGARVVMLDNSFVQTSSTPITHADAQGNTYQMRTLDDGSTHEVLKNFPTPEQAIAALGPRARDPQWIDFHHYWVLEYQLS
ncbi:class I SAM-dependent methyltransferase [Ideonella sp. A 288]|uniref:class I SAM-dependent methyltransferase n=1 Tax=Ideonella sp. A 288 TaxID=1962181 RepID=UPI001F3B525E|nr:class I SAM-dependent methyltransferase [Ideonella sp. A 288]